MTLQALLLHLPNYRKVFVSNSFELYNERDWKAFPEVLTAKVEDWFTDANIVFVVLKE